MKISINDKELLAISDVQKGVICNDINSDFFEEDLKRRIEWAIMHKYEKSFKRLKEEWDNKLIDNGVSMVPTNRDEYAKLVFEQPNYKCRKKRDMENKEK